ncbi:restriction endonuclease subunit S [Campylobacter sp. RM16191]|uniref:restriction endonuclease subunit S n=1 Tax=Campylobacter sp. RM16191 TaxID=1705728 RepID=UPI001475BA44|nr:restriction endonuclease subunit S [Campylobacter sp. RM16191]
MRIELKDISEIKIGLMTERKKALVADTTQKRYNLVSLKSFSEDGIYSHDFSENFISNEQLKDDYLVRKGDVLIRLRWPNFAVSIDAQYENLIFSSLVARLRLKNSFEPKFIAYYLNSNIVKKALYSDISGRIAAIKVSDLAKIKVPSISLQKQQQIVKFLEISAKKNEILTSLVEKNKIFTKSVFQEAIKG